MSVEADLLSTALAYLDGLDGQDGCGAFTTALRADKTGYAPCPKADMPGWMQATDWTALASVASRPLVEAVLRHSGDLCWWEPYDGDPRAGAGFAGHATANAIVGPWAALKTDAGGCGFFGVGQGVIYAEHAHAPDEIYVPIAGHAVFHCETYGTMQAGPDSLILQPSWKWHGLETPESPVLIFWAWTGEGLDRMPVFRAGVGSAVQVDL